MNDDTSDPWDDAPCAIQTHDHNGTIRRVNQMWLACLGYVRDEVVGKLCLHDILAPESRGFLDERRPGFLSHGRTDGVLVAMLRRDGTSFAAKCSAAATSDDAKDFEFGQLAFIAISAARPTNETSESVLVAAATRETDERKQAEAAARLASERLAQAIECIDEAFAIFDREGRLLMHNSAYRAFFTGAVEGPLIGHTAATLVSAWSAAQGVKPTDPPPWLASRFAQLDQPYVVNEVEIHGRAYREMLRKTNEGGVVLMISDRTTDHLREEALRKASAAKSEFLSSMSHELRTPLNAILGFAQLLQRDRRAPLAPRQLGMIEHILAGGEHLLRLIDEVLDLSRIEAGQVAISLEAVDLSKVLTGALTTLAPLAARSNVELEVAAGIDVAPHLLADRTRLAQILMNFGSNAIKYSPPGSRITFTTSAPTPGLVRVSVVDSGAGISVAEQDKIFQPFYRGAQGSGPIEGTGIGLAISRRLAALMSGSVGFHSVSGQGSEFWVELPVAPENAPDQTASSTSTAVPAADTNRQYRIVYVEDHPANIAFMKELLAEMTHIDLVTAPTAELGVELVRLHRPHVIIMDINLPGMSGIEALQLLRAWPETRNIPAIALSAAAMEYDIGRARDAGFDHYLTKPVRVPELIELLGTLLAAAPPDPASETGVDRDHA